MWNFKGLEYSNLLSCESLFILDCNELNQVDIENTNALLPIPHSNSVKGTVQLSTNSNDMGEEIKTIELCKAAKQTNYVAIMAETTDGKYVVSLFSYSYY